MPPAPAPQHHAVNDRWILFSIYPALALLTIHIGNDNALYTLLQMPSYYSDLLLALGCAYGLAFYYRVLFRKIDARFNWTDQVRARALYHLLYGVVVPVVVILGVEAVYLVWLLHMPLSQSAMFYLELPVVTTFCALMNLLYALLYFRRHNQALAQQLAQAAAGSPRTRPNFVVHAGTRTLNIAAAEVAYFCVLEKSTVLVTHQGQQYLYDGPLERTLEQVDPAHFFQINRQVVASRASVRAYAPTDTRKLRVTLTPPAPLDPCVSKTRATAFLRWLKEP